MYLSSVISPSVFRSPEFEGKDATFLSSFASVLADVCSQGNVILVDNRRQLIFALKKISEVSRYCNSQERFLLAQAIAAIGAQQSPMVVRSEIEAGVGESMTALAIKVANALQPDSMTCEQDSKESLRLSVDDAVAIDAVEEWKHSHFVDLNQGFVNGTGRITDLGQGKELIGRIVRSASVIRLYDKMFARIREGDYSKWLDTIRFILNAWDEYRLVSRNTPRLELIGMLPISPWVIDNRIAPEKRISKHEENLEHLQILEEEILEPLKNDWQGDVHCRLAEHPVNNQLFHDRWIQAGRAVTLVPAGFDFVRKNQQANTVRFSDGFRLKRDLNARQDLQFIWYNSIDLENLNSTIYRQRYL